MANLQQTGGGGGGTSLTGTGIARNTGACTELSGVVATSGSNATTLNLPLTIADTAANADLVEQNTTTATSGTTNASPTHQFTANYWTGAASSADTWTLGSSLAAGTNGASTLTLAHSGSTGTSVVSTPGIAAGDTSGLTGSYFTLLPGNTTGSGGTSPGLFLFYKGSVGALISCNGSNHLATNVGLDVGGVLTTTSAFSALGLASIGSGVGTQTPPAGSIMLRSASGSAPFIDFVENQQAFRGNIGYAAGSGTLKFETGGTGAFGSGTTLLSLTSTGALDFGTGLDVGISRLGAASLALGNGTASDITGGLVLSSVTNQSANGAQWVQGQASELLTLNTAGLTTLTAATLLPANAIIEAVVCRVTTTITTTTNWAVGDATTTSRFSSANSTLTAGTTSVGINHWSGAITTLAAGPSQAAAAKVQITCTGSNPGAGAIRITVFYRSFVAPTS